MERGYNAIDAARLLGITYRTMRKYLSNGTVRAKKIPGTRRWIVMESEIKRLQGIADGEEQLQGLQG